mgnify:CR=1 FL=1
MEVNVYQNKKNPNKYIELKHYKCGHYVWRQFLHWNTTQVTYYVGIGLHQRPKFWRCRKCIVSDVLSTDYAFAYSYTV